MADYNQAIAGSSFATATEERARRANITFLNELRWRLCNKWFEAGVEPHCAARVANRLGTEVAWSAGITPPMLIDTLVQRLRCELNSEGRFRLEAAAFGLYNGAKEAIKSVRAC